MSSILREKVSKKALRLAQITALSDGSRLSIFCTCARTASTSSAGPELYLVGDEEKNRPPLSGGEVMMSVMFRVMSG